MSGKISNWLGSAGKASPLTPFPVATPTGWDQERMGGLRRMLDSRALGMPTNDPYALSSMMTGVVYLSVNLLCKLVANAELTFHERDNSTPDGSIRLTHDDPIVQLYNCPNRIDTTYDLFYQVCQQFQLTGMSNVWAPPDRDPNRYDDVEISEMWSLPQVGMTRYQPSPEFPQGSVLYLPYGAYGNQYLDGYMYQGARIPAEQLVIFKNQHPFLRWEGYSVLQAMAKSIATLEAIDTSRLSVQQQGTEQSVAIEFDKEVRQPDEATIQRIKSEWFANYSGPTNAGKLVVLGSGASLNKFSTTPAEMAWESGWDQVAAYVMGAVGTTKALSGMVEGMTHSTLYGSLKANHITTLVPLLNNLAARHNKDILTPFYSSDVFMKLTGTPIHDDELLEKQISNDLSAGLRTVGEIRRERGLETLGEPWEKERAFVGGDPRGKEDERLTGEERDSKDRETMGQRDDPDASRDRPENIAGGGSLGPRGKSFGSYLLGDGDRAEQMLHAMEKMKSNGTIKDVPHRNGKVQVPVS
jgi:phage portal protein BeeE